MKKETKEVIKDFTALSGLLVVAFAGMYIAFKCTTLLTPEVQEEQWEELKELMEKNHKER